MKSLALKFLIIRLMVFSIELAGFTFKVSFRNIFLALAPLLMLLIQVLETRTVNRFSLIL